MVILTKLITPDGTELIPRYKYDYKEYTDKNGNIYTIDGGETYSTSGNGDEKLVIITTKDSFDIIRNNYARYNKFSKEYVILKNISDNWLQNIIDWYIKNSKTSQALLLFLEEKLYRAENEIFVSEQLPLGYA